MTQYLRGSFSVGAKPGENSEMGANWERTFGRKTKPETPTESTEDDKIEVFFDMQYTCATLNTALCHTCLALEQGDPTAARAYLKDIDLDQVAKLVQSLVDVESLSYYRAKCVRKDTAHAAEVVRTAARLLQEKREEEARQAAYSAVGPFER